MNAASALLANFLALAVTGSFQVPAPPPGAAKTKPLPDLPVRNHRLPLSGISRGPLSSPRPATEARPGTQAAKDLLAYYKDQKREPPWKDAVRQLSATEPGQRSTAASYLRDLL